MTLLGKTRAVVQLRLRRIEQALGGIEGVRVERRGDQVTIHGRSLRRRWIEDVRLRFAGRGR